MFKMSDWFFIHAMIAYASRCYQYMFYNIYTIIKIIIKKDNVYDVLQDKVNIFFFNKLSLHLFSLVR